MFSQYVHLKFCNVPLCSEAIHATEIQSCSERECIEHNGISYNIGTTVVYEPMPSPFDSADLAAYV
jgi:hypothetical protein